MEDDDISIMKPHPETIINIIAASCHSLKFVAVEVPFAVHFTQI